MSKREVHKKPSGRRISIEQAKSATGKPSRHWWVVAAARKQVVRAMREAQRKVRTRR